MSCCTYGTSARSVIDIDDDEDEDLVVVAPKKPWQTFLAPMLSGTGGLDFLTGGMPDRLIYFSGVDLWRYGVGGYTGFQWAPDGIQKEGVILRAWLSDNMERFTTQTRRYVSHIARGAILPGFQFTRGKASFQILGGLDTQADLLWIDGRSASTRARIGARFAADLWWEPTRWLMLQGAISGTTIDSAVSARAAAGWRLLDRFWVGPEVSRSADYLSRQTRYGAHLTGLRTGDYEWSFAAGHIDDSYHRDGVYARFGVLLRPPRPLFDEN